MMDLDKILSIVKQVNEIAGYLLSIVTTLLAIWQTVRSSKWKATAKELYIEQDTLSRQISPEKPLRLTRSKNYKLIKRLEQEVQKENTNVT